MSNYCIVLCSGIYYIIIVIFIWVRGLSIICDYYDLIWTDTAGNCFECFGTFSPCKRRALTHNDITFFFISMFLQTKNTVKLPYTNKRKIKTYHINARGTIKSIEHYNTILILYVYCIRMCTDPDYNAWSLSRYISYGLMMYTVYTTQSPHSRDKL